MIGDVNGSFIPVRQQNTTKSTYPGLIGIVIDPGLPLGNNIIAEWLASVKILPMLVEMVLA